MHIHEWYINFYQFLVKEFKNCIEEWLANLYILHSGSANYVVIPLPKNEDACFEGAETSAKVRQPSD